MPSVFGSVVSVFGSNNDFHTTNHGRKISTASAIYKPLATGPVKEREAITYDDVLPHLGGFGPYQRQIYVLLCLPVILCAFHKLSAVFTQGITPYRCALPFEDANASYVLPSDVRNMSVPWDEKTAAWSSCQRLDANFTEEYWQAGVPANRSVACDKYVFDRTKHDTSTVTEFNLVCEDAWMRAMADSVFMIGELIGSFTFGDLSDRYGRRPIFFIALVMQVVGGFLAAIAPEYITFILARMVVGATIPGVSLVAYVIGMEMVEPEKRVFAGIVTQYFFTTGYILTFVFSYFIKDWRTLQLALTVPGLVFLSYWWFIPESARWLMMKGRTEEAKGLFLKTAAKNKVTIPADIMDKLNNPPDVVDVKEEKTSLLDLFRYPNLRNKSLNIFFSWFVNNCTYYGLSWNTSNLGGNENLNYVLSGLVEIPAATLLIFTLNRWGRKSLLCGCMCIGGLMLLLTIAVPSDMDWLTITFYMMGKLAVTASYATIYLFSVEQFPTVIRNVGLGVSSTFARLGGITAPYVNLLSSYWLPLPQIVFGAMVLLGGLLALLLPETLDRHLPDTIAEGESFGKKPRKDDKELGVKLADVVASIETAEAATLKK